MGIVFRQSVKTTAVILGGALLGIATQYISALVFPQNQLGITRNLTNQGILLQIVLLMGTSSVTYLYLQRFQDQEEKKSVLLTFSLIVPLVTTLLFSVFYFLLKDYIITRFQLKDQGYIREFFAWLPVLGLAMSYMSMLEYYLISKMKAALSSFMREILLRILGLVLVLLFFWKLIDFHNFVVSSLLIFFIPPLILFFLARREKDFRFSFNYRALSLQEYKDVIHFSWYHLLTGVSLTLMGYIDALMLAPLSKDGSNDVAIYSFAQLLISILFIPYRALSVAAFPKINEAYIAQEQQKLGDMYGRTTLNILIASSLMFLLILGNVHNAAALLPPEYAELVPLLFILSIGKATDVATGLNSELISITPHYKFNFRLSLVLVITVAVLDRIYIPRYGIYGAAWITSLTLLAFNVVKTIFVYRKTGIQPFSRQGFITIGCGLVAFCIMYLVPRLSNPIADTALRSACGVFVFGGLILWLKPSPDLQAYLDAIRKNKKLLP